MITYKKQFTRVPTRISCTFCGASVDWSGMEAQEFVSIRHSCGWNSIFGNGNLFDIDICQHCLGKILKIMNIPVDDILVDE